MPLLPAAKLPELGFCRVLYPDPGPDSYFIALDVSVVDQKHKM